MNNFKFNTLNFRWTNKPPDLNKGVAVPETKVTELGSKRKNWKSTKSTFMIQKSKPQIRAKVQKRIILFKT